MRRPPHRHAALGPLALLALCASCTDADLMPLPDYPGDLVALSGNFCSTEPAKADYPIRVLFVVDSSDSMLYTDPQDSLVDAIENLVKQFNTLKNISFGIIRWGSQKQVVRELVDYATGPPDYFTKDETQLDAAFARMRQSKSDNPKKYLGGTDYQLALDSAQTYIEDDINNNPKTSGFHMYHVVFMTDGMPQAGSSDPDVTKDAIVKKIKSLYATLPLRVDVVAVAGFAVAPAFVNLLPSMASVGGGSYFPLDTPDTFDDEYKDVLVDYELLLEYELALVEATGSPKSILVQNRNMRIDKVNGVIDLYLDSDADGLVDPTEALLGTDPTDADSDQDGLDDHFEHTEKGFDPLAARSPQLSPAELADTDRDGLSYFVERALRTDPTRADTDGDGVVDGLEYRLGTNPLVADMRADPDGDGISNAFELTQHTNPQVPEPDALRKAISYIAAPVSSPYLILDGRRCYRFSVTNITLGETLASRQADGGDRPDGYNQLEIWRLEQPITTTGSAPLPQLMRNIRGTKWIIYRPSAPMRDPPVLELRMEDHDFDL